MDQSSDTQLTHHNVGVLLAARLQDVINTQDAAAHERPDDPRSINSANALRGLSAYVRGQSPLEHAALHRIALTSLEVGDRLQWGEEACRVAAGFGYCDPPRSSSRGQHTLDLIALSDAIAADAAPD